MSRSRVRLGPGIAHEDMAGEVIVYVPGIGEDSPSTTIHLSGGTAQVFLRVANGDDDVSPDSEHVEELMTLGVLVTDTTPSVSRRTALTVGAVGVGAGITLLALPQVAAAASLLVEGTWVFTGNTPADGIQLSVILSTPPEPTPSALVIPEITGEIPFRNAVEPDGGGTRFFWFRSLSPLPDLSGPLVGTFTLNGNPYRATFADVNEDG